MRCEAIKSTIPPQGFPLGHATIHYPAPGIQLHEKTEKNDGNN